MNGLGNIIPGDLLDFVETPRDGARRLFVIKYVVLRSVIVVVLAIGASRLDKDR